MARSFLNFRNRLVMGLALLCALALLPIAPVVARAAAATAATFQTTPATQKVVRVGLFKDTCHLPGRSCSGHGQELAQKTWKATDHLLALVNDVLDMNKLESRTCFGA